MAISFFKDRTIAPRNDNRAASPIMQIGSIRHIGKREGQEDAFGVSELSDARLCAERGFLAVVADGMGGLSAGAAYSALAVDCFMGRFATPSEQKTGASPGNPAERLMDLLAETVKSILRMIDEHDFPLGGTTLTAANIHEGLLHFISVGDSRIYLMRGGALMQLSREHVYSVELDDNAIRGEITFEKARADPQRRALTSYLGMERLALIDRSIHPVRLLPKDYVLLMTDGVFGTLSEDEIASIVFGGAAESADRIEKAILKKSKPNQDNFTAIVISCV